jgi:hypothetical protein
VIAMHLPSCPRSVLQSTDPMSSPHTCFNTSIPSRKSKQPSKPQKQTRVVKMTYQIPPSPILVPRIVIFHGPQHHPAPDQVQNLPSCVGHVNHLKTFRSTYQYKIRPAWARLHSLGMRATNQCPPSIYRVPLSRPRSTLSDQSCHYSSASPNKPARTSSVYLMILSASDVYIIATNTLSRELDFS